MGGPPMWKKSAVTVEDEEAQAAADRFRGMFPSKLAQAWDFGRVERSHISDYG
jgi:hypothetical protein